MNGDRCYHVPMSEGQSMCSCEDNRILLETIIQLQAAHIVALQRRLQRHKPVVVIGS